MRKKIISVLVIINTIMLNMVSAYAGFYNIASEYDGLAYNYRQNCVMFARYKVPTLPYGLTYYSAKKNICNSNSAIAGEIAVMPSSNSPSYGHVAYVESVSGNIITILEGGVINKYDGIYHINRRSGTESQLEIYGYYNPGGLSAPVNNSGNSSNKYTAYVTGTDGSLVINSRPSAGYDIGYIPEGASCTVYPDKQSGNWYWVEYNGVSGYSYGKYISRNKPAAKVSTPVPVPSNNSGSGTNTYTGIIRGTDGSLVINSRPSAGYDIGYIPEGASCTVYPDKQSGNWYWVSYNGISGYSYGKYIVKQASASTPVSNTRTGIIRGTDGSLVINSQPRVGYDIGYIPEGASCTVYPDKQSGNWYWVSYNGISGYSYGKYIVLQ